MKLLRVKPFEQPENLLKKYGAGKFIRKKSKPVECCKCTAPATREAVYRGGGYMFVRKYCENCEPEKVETL